MILSVAVGIARAELRVPGASAYLAPDPSAARVSARAGVGGWKDPQVQVLWFGQYGEKFTRPAVGTPPAIELPAVE